VPFGLIKLSSIQYSMGIVWKHAVHIWAVGSGQ
jgi:hypothetical protein